MKTMCISDEGQPQRWITHMEERLAALGLNDGLPFAVKPVERFGRRWWFKRVPRYMIEHVPNKDAPSQCGRVAVSFFFDADYDLAGRR
jgi:hypothetical protein